MTAVRVRWAGLAATLLLANLALSSAWEWSDLMPQTFLQMQGGAESCEGWTAEHVGGDDYGWCAETPHGGKIPIGGVCSAICKEGFDPMPDTKKLKCQADGRFAPTEIHCFAGPCPLRAVDGQNPRQLCEENYGGLEGKGIPSGNNCTLVCNAGYYPYPPVISCSKKKASALNQCIRMAGACSMPELNPHVEGVGAKACVGQGKMDLFKVCDVDCEDGWMPATGGMTTQFTCDPEFVPNPVAATLTCVGKPCAVPDWLGNNVLATLAGGCVEGQRMEHTSSCSVRCQDGYEPTADGMTTAYSCYAGKRTDATLLCHRKNCHKPDPDALFGKDHFSEFNPECPTLFEDQCDLKCIKGYRGPGRTFACNTEAQWEGVAPTCEIIHCPDLVPITGMKTTKHCNTFYLSTCTYVPGPGYQGTAHTLTCEHTGLWSQDRPTNVSEVICEKNYHVHDHECVRCEPGMINAAGDSAAFGDTACSACPVNTYRPQDSEECLPCPNLSITDGVTGASSISQCKCVKGHHGTVQNAEEANPCKACPADTYKDEVGTMECRLCPEHSSTDQHIAVETVSGCLCDHGYHGNLVRRESTCSACPENTFKPEIGTAACSLCPEHSTSMGETARWQPAQCLCLPGFSGTVSSVNSVCTACAENNFKVTHGTQTCSACPAHSHTEGFPFGKYESCVCNTGYKTDKGVNHGQLTEAGSKCEEIKCNALLVSLDPGQTSNLAGQDTVDYGTELRVFCKEGYWTKGATGPFKCNGEGRDTFGDHDVSGLACTAITCKTSALEMLEGHELTKDGELVYKETVTARCKEGYTHNVAAITYTCDGTGPKGYGENPDPGRLVCTRIKCNGDSLEVNSGQQCSAHGNHVVDYGEQARYSCKEGFWTEGATGPFTCTGSGETGFGAYDPNPLKCTPIQCKPADVKLAVGQKLDLNKFALVEYNTVGTITCKVEYWTEGRTDQIRCVGVGEDNFNDVDSSGLKCKEIVCSPDAIRLQPYQVVVESGEDLKYGETAHVVCMSGYRAKAGVALPPYKCVGTGADLFANADTSPLTCEDTDPCTETVKWDNSVPTSFEDAADLGILDGFAASGFNTPHMYCASMCSIDPTCKFFYVYGKDTDHPHRCATFTKLVEKSGAEADGKFYQQTCNFPPTPTPSGAVVPTPVPVIRVTTSITTSPTNVPIPTTTTSVTKIPNPEGDGEQETTVVVDSISFSPSSVVSETELLTQVQGEVASPSPTSTNVVVTVSATQTVATNKPTRTSATMSVPVTVTVTDANGDETTTRSYSATVSESWTSTRSFTTTVTAVPSVTRSTSYVADVDDEDLPFVSRHPTTTAGYTYSPLVVPTTTTSPSPTRYVTVTASETLTTTTINGQQTQTVTVTQATQTVTQTLVPSSASATIFVPSPTTTVVIVDPIDPKSSPGSNVEIGLIETEVVFVSYSPSTYFSATKDADGNPSLTATQTMVPVPSVSATTTNTVGAVAYYPSITASLTTSATSLPTTVPVTVTVPVEDAPNVHVSHGDFFCVESLAFDLFAAADVDACKASCALGVADCQDDCGDRDPGGELPCDAVAFSADEGKCVVYNGCRLSTNKGNTGFRLWTFERPTPDANGNTQVTSLSPTIAPTNLPSIVASTTLALTVASIQVTTSMVADLTWSPTTHASPTETEATVPSFTRSTTASPLPQAEIPSSVPKSYLEIALYADTLGAGAMTAQTRWTGQGDEDGFAVVAGTPHVVTKGAGDGSKCVSFDGDDAMLHSAATTINGMHGGSSRTVEFWFFVEGEAGLPTRECSVVAWGKQGVALKDCSMNLFDNAASGSAGFGGSTNNVGWWGGQTVAAGTAGSESRPPATGSQWHHYVMTYDQTTATARVYIDGVLQSARSELVLNTEPGHRVSIGAHYNADLEGGTPARFWTGCLSALRVWPSFVMSPEDVAAVTRTGETGKIYPPDTRPAAEVDAESTDPMLGKWFLEKLPTGQQRLVVQFTARQTSLAEGTQSIAVIGGDAAKNCGGGGTAGAGLLVGTSTEGCPQTAFRLFVGMQCNVGERPLLTACDYSVGQTYNVRVAYRAPMVHITVGGRETSALKFFSIMKTHATNGYLISLLSGSHHEAFEPFQGTVSSFRVFVELGPATTPSPTVAPTTTVTETTTLVPVETVVASVVYSPSIVVATIVPSPTPIPTATHVPSPTGGGTGGGTDGGTGGGGGGDGTDGDGAPGGGGHGNPSQPTPTPTKDPSCQETLLRTNKAPNAIHGANGGCNNDFAVSGYDSPQEYCAYRCSVDSTCNVFWVFPKTHSPPGRCCLQETNDEAGGFHDNTGELYSQVCAKPKPDEAVAVYAKHIIKSFTHRTLGIQRDADGDAVLAAYDANVPAHYFMLVPASNDVANAVSVANVAAPDRLVRHHGDGTVGVEGPDDSESYADDTSFFLEKPLNGATGSFSFRSTNRPSSYLLKVGNTVGLAALEMTDEFRNRATFVLDPELQGTDVVYKGLEGHYCLSNGGYDLVPGTLTADECRAHCTSKGVSDCKDQCDAATYNGGAATCTHALFMTHVAQCYVYHLCEVSALTVPGAELFESVIDLPDPDVVSCTECDSGKEVEVRECTSQHDRVCECAVGYAGVASNCHEVECHPHSTRSADRAKCACDLGYKGGPFEWQAFSQSYAAGACAPASCPAFSTKSADLSKCVCDEGFTSDAGTTFPFSAETQGYGSKECKPAPCPDNAGGPKCECDTGFVSSSGEGQKGAWSVAQGRWLHKCTRPECPAFSKRVDAADGSGAYTCSCQGASTGAIVWVDSRWSGACNEVDCPAGTSKVTEGRCRCPDGYSGYRVWSSTAGAYVGQCDLVLCPVTTVTVAGGCDCKEGQVGDCKWARGPQEFECTCQGARCPAHSDKDGGGGDSLCKCLVGYKGTLTWDNDRDEYRGECVPTACPQNAHNFPTCSCATGYKATGGGIAWSAADQEYKNTCAKVDCPANADNSAHPACSCATGYRFKEGRQIAWVDGEWVGECEPIPCPAHAGNDPPRCACEAGFKPEDLKVVGAQWVGRCAAVECPLGTAGADHPACRCGDGYKGTVAWKAATWSWEASCALVGCPAPSLQSVPGRCACPVAYTGACEWNHVTAEWRCTCERKPCPSLSTFSADTGLCQCDKYGTLAWVVEEGKYEGKCSNQPFEGPGTQAECALTGVGHVSTEMIPGGGSFNLHGKQEWVVMSGPFADFELPHFQAQATSAHWKQVARDRQCFVEEPYVAVFKDVALKCGEFHVLLKAPEHVMNDAQEGCLHAPIRPKLYVKGTGADGHKYEAVDILPSIGNDHTVAFHGGSLRVSGNACRDGCPNTNIPADRNLRAVEFSFYCGEPDTDRDTEVLVTSDCVASGGCFTDLHINVPPASNMAELKDGTMARGVCGGWAEEVSGDTSQFHSACRNLQPFAFYPDGSCVNHFTTKEFNSVFRKFEQWTNNGDDRYDAWKWDVGGQKGNGDNGEPERPVDEARLDAVHAKCIEFRKRLDSREEAALDPRASTIDSMLVKVSEACAEDMYWGIPWTAETMRGHVCSAVAPKVRFERMDIKCASVKLHQGDHVGQDVLEEVRKDCHTCLPPRTAGQTVAADLTENHNLLDELLSSLNSIKKMSFPGCEFDPTDVSELDCENHVFRNTGEWRCGRAIPPPLTNFIGECKSDLDGDTCTAECKLAYTRTGNQQSGLMVCEKVQGEGIEGVDVEMKWSTPTLACRACHNCDQEAEERLEKCSSDTDTVCGCKAGSAGPVSTFGVPTGCQLCAAGKFADKVGLTECKPCEAEVSFSALRGATECTPCRSCGNGEVFATTCAPSTDTVCQCDKGFAGVAGDCQACTGTTYSDEKGLGQCKTCATCGANEAVKQACTDKSNTECHCRAGFAGVWGNCVACDNTKTFAAKDGQLQCDECMECNNPQEHVKAECNTKADTVCQCDHIKALENETCYHMWKRLRE